MIFDFLKYASVSLTILAFDYKCLKNNYIINFIKSKYNIITAQGLTEELLKKEIQKKKIAYIDDSYIHETYDIIDAFDEIE